MGNTVNRISKMGSQLAAPSVDTYIHTLYRNSSIVNEDTIKIMKELFAELKKIKSCGDNERRELWIEVPKGTIADFGDYETAKEYGDVENYEEFESILVICQELFEKDFAVDFRKKGNFNRPSRLVFLKSKVSSIRY